MSKKISEEDLMNTTPTDEEIAEFSDPVLEVLKSLRSKNPTVKELMIISSAFQNALIYALADLCESVHPLEPTLQHNYACEIADSVISFIHERLHLRIHKNAQTKRGH